MKTRFVSMFAGAVLLAALPVQAHHSFAAEFDVNQPITLRGTLTRMEWFNPHGWIYIDVKDADGKVTNWGIEAGAPTTLLRRGLRKTDFPIGSEVVVEGYRAKGGAPRANGKTLTFKDGRNFFLGASDSPGDASAPGGGNP
jgi:Family of unknown function (DUF6152)